MSNTDITVLPQPATTAAVLPPESTGGGHAGWASAAAIAAAALQACGGGSDAGGGAAGISGLAASRSADPAAGGPSAEGLAAVRTTRFAGGIAGPLGQARTYAMPASDNEAARFLNHCQFNASDADIALARSLGYAGYLAQQFDKVPVNTAWTWLNQRGYGVLDQNNFHFTPYQIDFAVWNQLFTSADSVRKRVTLALSEIFVVSTNSMSYFWLCHTMANWWDTLSANSLGSFRTLLEKVTLHPAMGMYLSSRGSQKDNAAGRQPDENYARELMQLMTIGLVKLNQDGSMVTSGGVPVESYNQDDVRNLARVFTGYDLNMTASTYQVFNGLNCPSTTFTRLPMVLNPSLHSDLEVNFLGSNIPAGTEGNAARGKALDTLFNHPNVGPFIGRQLIQRLVTSNPSPAYVARVAAAFADNGQGVRGDLAATVSAVLLDDEARSPQGLTSPTFGRLREPMIRMVQWGRTFGIRSARGSWKMYDQSLATQLAQSPLRAPSVFNFFRPGYLPPGTAMASAGLVAPEFQLVNESTVSAYLNYLNTVVRSGIYVGAPDLPQITGSAADSFDIGVSYTRELQIAHDARALVDRINTLMAAGQLSGATVALIVDALEATPLTPDAHPELRLNRIGGAVLLVMASSEYLVQK